MTSFPDVALGLPEDGERLDLPFGTFFVRLAGERTGGAMSVVQSVLEDGQACTPRLLTQLRSRYQTTPWP